MGTPQYSKDLLFRMKELARFCGVAIAHTQERTKRGTPAGSATYLFLTSMAGQMASQQASAMLTQAALLEADAREQKAVDAVVQARRTAARSREAA